MMNKKTKKTIDKEGQTSKAQQNWSQHSEFLFDNSVLTEFFSSRVIGMAGWYMFEKRASEKFKMH